MRRTWIRALAIVACLGTAAAHGVVPTLPFATNPDPDLCGIPVPMGVDVVMFQDNPELDFYFVQWQGPGGTESGWVPAPYLDVASARGGD